MMTAAWRFFSEEHFPSHPHASDAIALAFQPIANAQVSYTIFPRVSTAEYVFGTWLRY